MSLVFPDGTTSTDPVTVPWATQDGTAKAGLDYTARTAQTVTIPAGETSATIDVRIIDDQLVEPDQTFPRLGEGLRVQTLRI